LQHKVNGWGREGNSEEKANEKRKKGKRTEEVIGGIDARG